jgi:hypothetical protein
METQGGSRPGGLHCVTQDRIEAVRPPQRRPWPDPGQATGLHRAALGWIEAGRASSTSRQSVWSGVVAAAGVRCT